MVGRHPIKLKQPNMPKKPTVSNKVRGPRRRASEKMGATGIHRAHQPMMAELYRRSEARLRAQRRVQRSKAGEQKTEADIVRALQELEVHQIELELQNAELKKARNELEVMLEKSTDLYDFAPVGYVSIDDSGLILEANLTSAAMLDKERSQLVDRCLLVFMSPTSRPIFLTFLKQVFSGHRNQTCEALFLKQGGGTFWGSLRAASAIRPRGERKWCRVVIGDITARKEAEEALHESEKRYRSLFEVVPVAAYSCDASGVIQEFNDQAAELWGRVPAAGDTDKRFCGSFKLFRPDGSFMPHEQCPMAEVISGKIPAVHDAEVLIERPDGSRITVVVNIRPLSNERGEVTGAINCFYDITERKQAAERIRVSEVRYRRLFEAAHDGVLLLDPGTCKITDANPFMTKLLGYSHEQLVGKELFEISLLKDEAASREMFQKLKRKHEVRYEDLPLESQQGRHQEVEVVANLYQENGHSVIQCNIRDITERKHAENALRESHAELRLHADELARFNCVAVGRESRMIELKKEVNELCQRQNEAARYPLEFEKEGKDTHENDQS